MPRYYIDYRGNKQEMTPEEELDPVLLATNMYGDGLDDFSDRRRRRQVAHGESRSPEYRAWNAAHARCTNKRATGYAHYGGRGIRFAEEWCDAAGSLRFLEHVGRRPSASHSLDRIDNNGHYEPGNVRWATKREQMLNRRISIRKQVPPDAKISAFGITKTAREWAVGFGCDESMLFRAFGNRKL